MAQSSPFLTLNNTVLWLKVGLSAAMLVLLWWRYRAWKKAGAAPRGYSLRTRVALGLAVVFSFGLFHNLGTFRAGTFLHYGEVFHYYLGSKYFNELGYFELYNAVIVADAEQGSVFANLPFYTDLKTYKQLPRATAVRDADRIRGLFSEKRWSAFKDDVSFFKEKINLPGSPDMIFLLMDHGYNASPVSTFVLGRLTNAVPVAQVGWLAAIDVFLVLLMMLLVFRTFGFATGALFSVYFFVSILSGHEYLSGSLLRYDWLLYIVVALCLLDKERHAWSAFFFTLAAMLRIFPGVLFFGVAVTIFKRVRAARAFDTKSSRFVASAGITALALFLLPAVSTRDVLRPWEDFYAKTSLHDSGVYVNHLGLRGVLLFEPSHLSLERFVEKYKSADIVRRWQDVKEYEFRNKRPIVLLASFLVLVCVAAIIWKSKEHESVSILWALLLVYTTSYLSVYYYTFMCLFVLLFFRRTAALSGFVPLCLLLTFNIVALLTDYSKPSPIVFYTLINLYLFGCLASILGFELYTGVLQRAAVASQETPRKSTRESKPHRRQARPRRK